MHISPHMTHEEPHTLIYQNLGHQTLLPSVDLIMSLRVLKVDIWTANEYIEDRRHALELWANVLIGFEHGEMDNVTPLHEF